MKYTPSRTNVVVVACLGLVLAGTFAMTPAGASLTQEVQASAQHNWNKIWKQKIRPKSDRRYYTKAKAKDRFAEQDDVWTRLEADLKYAAKADTWTKAEADAKYQAKPVAYRGTYIASGNGAGSLAMQGLSYGVTLAAPPTAHYIRLGDPVPAGCSGSAAAPNADPGHLCVFETNAANVNLGRFVTNTGFVPNTATQTGAYLFTTVAAAGNGFFGGTWVLRPGGGAVVAGGGRAPALSGVGAQTP